jgi:hypothetical protein
MACSDTSGPTAAGTSGTGAALAHTHVSVSSIQTSTAPLSPAPRPPHTTSDSSTRAAACPQRASALGTALPILGADHTQRSVSRTCTSRRKRSAPASGPSSGSEYPPYTTMRAPKRVAE